MVGFMEKMLVWTLVVFAYVHVGVHILTCVHKMQKGQDS